MPSRSIIRTGVGRIGSQGIASRPWRRRSISSPRERLAFSRDETSVDPSARSSITPTQSLHSIVRGRALKLALALKDVRLALAAGEQGRVPMPFASVLRDNLLEAVAQGDGDKDFAALARVASRRANLNER